MTDAELAAHALATARRTFETYKGLGDRALAQMRDGEWDRAIGPESNSVAIIVKHMHGNMRSRWTDFLTSDGEKPWRERDDEFEGAAGDRATLLGWWEEGWAALFGALDGLTAADLGRTVTIRGQPLTVTEALNRQIAHYAYHVGQIVMLARHAPAGEWQSLSIPRGASKQYERDTRESAAKPR